MWFLKFSILFAWREKILPNQIREYVLRQQVSLLNLVIWIAAKVDDQLLQQMTLIFYISKPENSSDKQWLLSKVFSSLPNKMVHFAVNIISIIGAKSANASPLDKCLKMFCLIMFLIVLLFYRPLAFDGRDGHGVVRGLHRLRPASESESVDSSPLRTFALRRLLGLLLSVRLQRERHGQSRYQVNLFVF